MDVDAAFPAGPEPAELVQPGDRALHRPTLCPEAGAVGFPAAGDGRGDTPCGQQSAVLHMVVGAVGEQVAAARGDAWTRLPNDMQRPGSWPPYDPSVDLLVEGS